MAWLGVSLAVLRAGHHHLERLQRIHISSISKFQVVDFTFDCLHDVYILNHYLWFGIHLASTDYLRSAGKNDDHLTSE